MSRPLATCLALLLALSATAALALPSTAAANGCPLRFSQGTSGTEADPIRIDTVADLTVLANNASCYRSSYVFKQTADLALTGVWTPIGASGSAFTGTYDGNGHVISGLTTTAANFAGLFGVAENATFRRLTLTGAQVAVSSAHAGVLAGRLENSSVEEVHVRSSSVAATGTALGDGYSGGLVGEIASSTLATVSADATVNVAGAIAGGLVGAVSDSTITDATASGTVEADDGIAGGLLGLLCGSQVTRASASGAVDSGSGIGGGLVGTAGDVCVGSFSAAPSPTALITDSQGTGAVTGVGPVGGFVGTAFDFSVVRSYATGSVTSSGGPAGGFVGTASSTIITDAYARGAVTAPAGVSAAGFAAGASFVTFTRVLATGLVSGTATAGGLVEGYAPTYCAAGQVEATCISESSVTASFWDTQTTRQASSLYGAGKTTADLQSLGTYTAAGWPIASGWTETASTTWGICSAANGGYPYLLRQYTTATEPCTVVPSAPRDPLATSQYERILIAWKAPASDGGSAITSYTATAKPGGRSCTVAAPKLQCLITGLDNGTSYVVSITAANKRGAGAAAKAAKVAPAPALGVGRVSQDGSTIITQVAVNGAGALSQVGALDPAGQSRRLMRGLRPLCRASKSVKAAGTITLRCTIDPTQLASGSLRVRLTTQFKAKGGGIFTRRQTFTVRGTGTGTARPSSVTG